MAVTRTPVPAHVDTQEPIARPLPVHARIIHVSTEDHVQATDATVILAHAHVVTQEPIARPLPALVPIAHA